MKSARAIQTEAFEWLQKTLNDAEDLELLRAMTGRMRPPESHGLFAARLDSGRERLSCGRAARRGAQDGHPS